MSHDEARMLAVVLVGDAKSALRSHLTPEYNYNDI